MECCERPPPPPPPQFVLATSQLPGEPEGTFLAPVAKRVKVSESVNLCLSGLLVRVSDRKILVTGSQQPLMRAEGWESATCWYQEPSWAEGFLVSAPLSSLGAYSILGNKNGSSDRHASPPFLQSLLCVKHIVPNLLQTWGVLSACPGNQQLAYAADRMLQAGLVDL